MVYLFYTTYISVDLAHHEIFHAKVGKGGIRAVIPNSVTIFQEWTNVCKMHFFQIFPRYSESMSFKKVWPFLRC